MTIPSLPTLRGPSRACDEDECCGPSPALRILVALAGGAAPVLANYLLLKFDPGSFQAEEEEEK